MRDRPKLPLAVEINDVVRLLEDIIPNLRYMLRPTCGHCWYGGKEPGEHICGLLPRHEGNCVDRRKVVRKICHARHPGLPYLHCVLTLPHKTHQNSDGGCWNSAQAKAWKARYVTRNLQHRVPSKGTRSTRSNRKGKASKG